MRRVKIVLLSFFCVALITATVLAQVRRVSRSGARSSGAIAQRRAYLHSRPSRMNFRRARSRMVFSHAGGRSRALPAPRPAPPDLPEPVPPALDEGRRVEPSGPRAPHGMGIGGAYAYRAPDPPPAGLRRPVPSIADEFLSRVREKHAKDHGTGTSVGAVAVKAARPESVGSFDPDNPGDAAVLVLDGNVSSPSGGGSGLHNRDQGGKPGGGGKGAR